MAGRGGLCGRALREPPSAKCCCVAAARTASNRLGALTGFWEPPKACDYRGGAGAPRRSRRPSPLAVRSICREKWVMNRSGASRQARRMPHSASQSRASALKTPPSTAHGPLRRHIVRPRRLSAARRPGMDTITLSYRGYTVALAARVRYEPTAVRSMRSARLSWCRAHIVAEPSPSLTL